jgi:hypothetical protein
MHVRDRQEGCPSPTNEVATLLLLVKPFLGGWWSENGGQNNDEPLGYEGELL